VLIVNGVLVSTCLYFLAIWGGTKQGVKQATSLIMNYYWSGVADRVCIGVAREVCCYERSAEGLNSIDPSKAVYALMTKWIIAAHEPGVSNFKTILRY
jgi:hypothetical protein